CMQVREFPWTF
nr:immunoglobulin light chain junction region [Macaca mulatta]MOX84878.1 immunoglobulin light chain junction region [Macaca mulatta]MOX86830.1 immunoglobulin light chain junction region [Macaca mulatta]MOX87368.1 immunoglobulin light chain junction region [Macaca mulatta]MOX87957.1 immunoglobulin light chain junction region [Macaca mulatta]